MLILVINCGSSSAKYQLFDIGRRERCLEKGIIERVSSHEKAVREIFRRLDKYSISAVAHRVVHGKDQYSGSVRITKDVLRTLEEFSELAPLHNPPSLAGIRAARKFARQLPQIAVFDTAFHQTMPPEAYTYAIPYKYQSRYGIRKYGFHGTSHKYVALEAARRLKKPITRLKLITCHLGNGCSMSAVKYGRCVDTSMGFTPLQGLVMGTRCGDIDPAVIFYLSRKAGMPLAKIDEMLNKKSGLLGLSGIGNDVRDIIQAAKRGHRRARLALGVFCYSIQKYIGAYIAAMGGADAVIFTAGIGEHSPWIRRKILTPLESVMRRLGIRALVIPTNEELMIAREAAELV